MAHSKSLNNEQLQAVTHGNGPLLIVAGAGTGKTTVITQRISWLIEHEHAKSDEIVALTFTDKAANEMQERVDMLLPYGYLDTWISTFHAFCEKILKNHAMEIGLSTNFKLLTEVEQWVLIRKNLDRFDLNYYRPRGNPTKFIHAIIKHFSRCKDELISPQNYLDYVERLRLDEDNAFLPQDFDTEETKAQEIQRLRELADAYHTYQQLLIENNAMDFGDLITYTMELFQKRPLILSTYQKKFKFILVDEFQDTNLAQYELIKLLTATNKNITVVADDDQCIFRFRGAAFSNIVKFLEDYPDTKKILLINNYRTRQNILDLAYTFISQNNPDRLEVKLENLGLNKKLISQHPDHGVIEHLHATDVDQEIELVIAKIIELYNQSEQPNWNDFAILVRANDTARLFVEKLDTKNIPNIFFASKGLYGKPIILDVLAYLRAIVDFHDSHAIYRLLNLPIFDVTQIDIMNLNHFASKKSLSLYEVLRQIPAGFNLTTESISHIEKLLELMNSSHQQIKFHSVREIFLAFMMNSGYLQWIQKQSEAKQKELLRYLNQFDRVMKQYLAATPRATVKEFMDDFEYLMEAGESGNLSPDLDDGPEMVKIMTIHSAKGLEFRYVFVVHLVDKKFPTIERHEAIAVPEPLLKDILPQGDSHLQEERRLFYVACTRAKECLFFTSAEDYGGIRSKKISRFLTECGFSLPETNESPPIRKLGISSLVIKKNTNETSLPVPDYFSFSQIKSYNTCPLQYKFAHVFKIPTAGNAQFSFGDTMHGTLQKFFDAARQKAQSEQLNLLSSPVNITHTVHIRELVSIEELNKYYDESWIDDWYPSQHARDERRDNGKRILKQFYDSLPDEMKLPVALEKQFRFRLNNYMIHGRFDRIDEPRDNEIEIIDYKTGGVKQLKDISKEDKAQLLIYQMAYEQMYARKPTRLTYYYLEDNKMVSFLGTEEELEKLQSDILNTIDSIRTRQFPAKPSFMCKFCPYKNICEYRQNNL